MAILIPVADHRDVGHRSFDLLQVGRRQLDVDRAQVLIQSFEAARAGDRRDPGFLRQQPGQRDLRRGGALRRGDALVAVIGRAVEEQGGAPKDRAFAILAEMLLMQHTCHWYCRSKAVASARMLASHQTSYEQLVGGVLPQTRQEYLELVS